MTVGAWPGSRVPPAPARATKSSPSGSIGSRTGCPPAPDVPPAEGPPGSSAPARKVPLVPGDAVTSTAGPSSSTPLQAVQPCRGVRGQLRCRLANATDRLRSGVHGAGRRSCLEAAVGVLDGDGGSVNVWQQLHGGVGHPAQRLLQVARCQGGMQLGDDGHEVTAVGHVSTVAGGACAAQGVHGVCHPPVLATTRHRRADRRPGSRIATHPDGNGPRVLANRVLNWALEGRRGAGKIWRCSHG